MAIVMLAIGSTDLLFAFDSIPAIFGLTEEPYIVFTANAFALLGLRQLYFLLGGLLSRLVYLSVGLAFILAFIGVKLVIHALRKNELPFINGGEHVGGPGVDLALAHDHPRCTAHRHGGQPCSRRPVRSAIDQPVVDQETARSVPAGPEAWRRRRARIADQSDEARPPAVGRSVGGS